MLAGWSKSNVGRPTRCTVCPRIGAASASAVASCPEPPVTRIGVVMSRRVPLATLGKKRQGAVLVRQDRLAWRDRPGDGECRVVPDHPALGLPIPRCGDLVDHLGVRLERAVAVQQSRRNPELLPVLYRK